MNERNKSIIIAVIIFIVYAALYFLPILINPVESFLRRDHDAGCAKVCLLCMFTIIMQSVLWDWKIVKILNIVVGGISAAIISYFAFFAGSSESENCLGLLIFLIAIYIGFFFVKYKGIKKIREERANKKEVG